MRHNKTNYDPKWNTIKDVLKEGLTPRQASLFDVLAENTKDHYLKTALQVSGNTMLMENASSGSISASNIGSLVKTILPVLRRALPQTFIQDLVGVVPMDSPVVQIATLRPEYGQTIAGANTVAGQEALAPLHVRDLAGSYSGNEMDTNPAGAPTALLEGVLGNTLSMSVLKQTVTAKTRRISGRWTDEALMDAQSQYGIDLAGSMLEQMSSHVTQEINNEILQMMRGLVPTPTAANTFDQASVSGQPNSVVDEFSALSVLMARESYRIAARTRKAPANWAVLSPAMISVLESARASTLARTTNSGTDGFAAPTVGSKIGRLNDSMDIYSDMYANDSTPVLLGLKVSDVDSPVYYCPYVPLSQVGGDSGGFYDPNTLERISALYTRYAVLSFTDTNTSLGNSQDYLSLVGVNSTNLSFI